MPVESNTCQVLVLHITHSHHNDYAAKETWWGWHFGKATAGFKFQGGRTEGHKKIYTPQQRDAVKTENLFLPFHLCSFCLIAMVFGSAFGTDSNHGSRFKYSYQHVVELWVFFGCSVIEFLSVYKSVLPWFYGNGTIVSVLHIKVQFYAFTAYGDVEMKWKFTIFQMHLYDLTVKQLIYACLRSKCHNRWTKPSSEIHFCFFQ